ncbi:MAG: CDP-alcohol phosphatidyltransferase family protein [Desulfobulbaceae bacterium]|nr:CDP-alcohol phosphatidyltransferase family protein [Desulfobulbaceae bacterium]
MTQKLFTRFVRWIGYDLGISPNQITLGRLFFFVPGWFMWVYMHELGEWSGVWWQAIGLAAILLVTTVIAFDIVDGALARETGQVSSEGKVLDPLVDKFITYSSLVLFWPAISKTALIILFSLDIASTFLRGVQVQGANEFGKKKAVCQNISKIFFSIAVLTGFAKLNTVGNLLIWAALILAAISVGIRILPAKAKSPLYQLIPHLITLCNLLCGILAIACAIKGDIRAGVLYIFAAMGFDLSDGAAARRLGVESDFGKHFDTVADLISFGLAPAALVASTAGWSPAALIGGVLYLMATGLRLYDYGRSKDITPPGFFRGLPSPASAWLVTAGIACLPYPGNFIIMLSAGLLMCSFNINWQHFSSILPTLSIPEIGISIILGIIPAVFISPLGFLAGPILLYLLSPYWRKPGNRSSDLNGLNSSNESLK